MINKNGYIPNGGELVEVNAGFGWKKQIFYRIKTMYQEIAGRSTPFSYYECFATECYETSLRMTSDDTYLWQECRPIQKPLNFETP